MSRFNEVMDVVFRWEGGFVDNPYDNGGPTNMGVTHAVLAKWRGVSAVTPAEVRALTKGEAEQIFRSLYWDPIKGDALPPPLDLVCMDGAVNHGTGSLLKMLQSALDVAPTGQADAATIGAIEALTDRTEIISAAIAMGNARRDRYRSHEDYEHFKKGWRNRLTDVMTRALSPFGSSWTFDGGGVLGGDQSQEPISSLPRAAIDDTDLQTWLATSGLLSEHTPGVFDMGSVTATGIMLSRHSEQIAGDWTSWPVPRRKMALAQLLCDTLGFDPGRIDGLFGPRTEAAFLAYSQQKLGVSETIWRDDLPATASSVSSQAQQWPTEKDVPQFFGELGEDCALVPTKRLKTPFKMRLAWDLGTEIDGFRVHEKVHESAATAFEAVLKHYGPTGIRTLGLDLYGGCTGCRKKRGGSSWSMHAWSIAIDFDPARNQLKWDHRTARLAQDDAKAFWEIWESVGWTSLGRAADYDWMHVQAARLG